MQDATYLTDMTLVVYPSNHVLKKSLKIVLLGKGEQWKSDLIQEVNNYWTDDPITFFYIDNDTYDSDKLSWLYLNSLAADFIIGRISFDPEDILLIAPFVKSTATFIIEGDNVPVDFWDWFSTLNPNRNLHDYVSIVLRIKDHWKK